MEQAALGVGIPLGIFLIGYFTYNHRRIDKHDTHLQVMDTKLDYIKEGVDELKERK